ncbi:MAG: hypothetical protein Q7K35_00045 [bacterium]|nr:hypothetical protein [bacterium]
MSIKIKGHTISNVVLSTAMGHSGRGMRELFWSRDYQNVKKAIKRNKLTIFAKSSTYRKHKGNFRLFNPFTWGCIRRFGYNGMINAYGLTNDGTKVNAQKIARAIEKGDNVIPNFYPQFAIGRRDAIEEAIYAMIEYDAYLRNYFWAVEFNFSCPNAEERIQENMQDALACVSAVRREKPQLCQIAKISIVHPHEFAQRLVDAGVDIVHAINTIPHGLLSKGERENRKSPLWKYGGGGVSGGPIFPQAFAYNEELRKVIPKTPIIMGGGVTGPTQVRKYFAAGANAVSMCTAIRTCPVEAINAINEYAAEEAAYEQIGEIINKAAFID